MVTREERARRVPDCARGFPAWTRHVCPFKRRRVTGAFKKHFVGEGLGSVLAQAAAPLPGPARSPTRLRPAPSQRKGGAGERRLLARIPSTLAPGPASDRPACIAKLPPPHTHTPFLTPATVSMWGNFAPYFVLSTERIGSFKKINTFHQHGFVYSSICNLSALELATSRNQNGGAAVSAWA